MPDQIKITSDRGSSDWTIEPSVGVLAMRAKEARDSDPGAVARNFRVAEQTEETARARQESGNDRAERLRLLERGERLLRDAVHRQEAQQRKAKDAREAASWKRCKANVEQYKKRKAADARHKAAARERALDRAIEQEELRAQRQDQRINDSFSKSVRALGNRMLGRGKDSEPQAAVEIAEIGPEIAGSTDPDAAFEREWRAARQVLESGYLTGKPTSRQQRIDPSVDLQDYGGAARTLRAEDSLPTSHEEKMLREHQIARARLEAVRN